MACNKCGAKRGHLPGCQHWAAPIKRRQKAEKDKPKGSPNKWTVCKNCQGDGYLITGKSKRNPAGSRVQCGECHGYGRIAGQP